MQQPVPRDSDRGDLSLNGLDEVFKVDATVCDDFDQPDNTLQHPAATVSGLVSDGLTIKESSSYYGLAITTLRLKIKLGEIPAIKVNGPKGPEWRIYPNGIPAGLCKPDKELEEGLQEAGASLGEGSSFSDARVAEGFHLANINVASLIKANQELISKLEGATYRNGYLEAQLDAERNQIKLLTDRLHKAEPIQTESWWNHFCSWFKA